MSVTRRSILLPVACSLVVLLAFSGCRISTKDDAEGSGKKKVDIQTPVGDLHVSEAAQASDTGLTVYPGARLAEKKSDHDSQSANVNISTSAFGLKVVALHYESEDPTEKVVAFYTEELKKYGSVLQCRTSKSDPNVRVDHAGKNSEKLSCDEEDGGGKTVELKVGSENNQRIVAISPKGKGSEFALVRVLVRTGETI